MGIQQYFIDSFKRKKKRYWEKKNKKFEPEIQRLLKYPPFTEGVTTVFNKPFKFHDSGSFVVTYKELFEQEIYKFNPSANSNIILDCGANMGLSVLYFAKNYPNHKIIAFEPQENIFKVLQENVQNYRLKNVELFQKAVWDKEETLKFFTDGSMGGRVNLDYTNQKASIINAVPLRNLLNERVDFVKIDIEGAEETVLKSCVGKLREVKHIFFEFHNNINQPQILHELLLLIKNEGFYYYIKESQTRKRPFVDKEIVCESFDMAINIFCYKT